MSILDKDAVYKVAIRFPEEPMSPWDVIKALEWAMEDHIRRFHPEVEKRALVENPAKKIGDIDC